MTAQEKIDSLTKQISDLKSQLAELKRAQPPQKVENFQFDSEMGPIWLSDLFGESQDLIMISNMGAGCSFCTLWADGLSGLIPELQSRASVVFVSPDPLDEALAFVKKRGWKFKVLTDFGAFRRQLGFAMDSGRPNPGAFGLHRMEDGSVVEIARAEFGPGDDFCAAGPLLELLKDGANEWEPSYRL